MIINFAVILFSVLAFTAIAFHFALALGAPWGHLTMGGKFPGKLPPLMRLQSLFSILVILFLVFIIQSYAGILFSQWKSFANSAIWFVLTFTILGSILNLITKSKWERILWAPVNLLMLASTLIIILN